MEILTPEFFLQPTLTVAKDLLGATLARKIEGETIRMLITETEAYDGFEDKASHAHKGKTQRTSVMFGKSGVWYVYLVYGMHWMLNVVTREEGYPAAVLIRATKEVSGPARLTKALDITKAYNERVAEESSGLWIEKGERVDALRITTSPRIGVAYAKEWAQKPYRFVLKV